MSEMKIGFWTTILFLTSLACFGIAWLLSFYFGFPVWTKMESVLGMTGYYMSPTQWGVQHYTTWAIPFLVLGAVSLFFALFVLADRVLYGFAPFALSPGPVSKVLLFINGFAVILSLFYILAPVSMFYGPIAVPALVLAAFLTPFHLFLALLARFRV